MRIKLQWDDQAIEHIGRHDVTPEEVEEVSYDPRSLIVGTRHKRYMVYGRTSSGRYLKVVVEPLGHGFFYPVTAYEMDETDRRRYRRLAR